ncbi:putative Uridine kinase [Rhodotorula taiwanensis]|uniref:Putative Uridine kinase n=1 Tax=Rhodotorula taiwanensis TaxID=741276 RepID=A0A2S5B5N5_9BASI|nr:putative Uridine kinase [Rhodotorula taiwanensis]
MCSIPHPASPDFVERLFAAPQVLDRDSAADRELDAVHERDMDVILQRDLAVREMAAVQIRAEDALRLRTGYNPLDSARESPYGPPRPRTRSYFTPLAEGGFGPTAPLIERPRARPARVEDPLLSCTLWEDERCIVVQVLVDGHVVARRTDYNWVNSTKLLNMVEGLSRGKRDMYLKNEPDRLVFRRGALHLKVCRPDESVLPLEAAARLARDHRLYDRLYPLFEPDPLSFLLLPLNRPRTLQLVETARTRSELMSLDQIVAEAGLSPRRARDLAERGRDLERVLARLEAGLRGSPIAGPSRMDAAARPAAAAYERDEGPAAPPARRNSDPVPASLTERPIRRASVDYAAWHDTPSYGTEAPDIRRGSVSSSSTSELSSLDFTPLGVDLPVSPRQALSRLQIPDRPDGASLSSGGSSWSLSRPVSRLRVTSVDSAPEAEADSDRSVFQRSGPEEEAELGAVEQKDGRPAKRARLATT